MNTTLITVILPSFNSEIWIKEAVKSVLMQTYKNIELIIVDDASTDDTMNILSKIEDARLIIIERSSCSGGPATPRNQAMEIAKGQYLAFIDSDDIWHPEKLERQFAIDKHRLNFVSSNSINFKNITPKTPKLTDNTITVNYKNHELLLRKNWVITSSALIKRDIFESIKFDPEYNGIEDYLAWLQLHQRDDVRSAVLEEPLVFYRMRSGSLSHSKYHMAKRIFHLLRNCRYRGESLGISIFYYFAYYAISSIITRLLKRSS